MMMWKMNRMKLRLRPETVKVRGTIINRHSMMICEICFQKCSKTFRILRDGKDVEISLVLNRRSHMPLDRKTFMDVNNHWISFDKCHDDAIFASIIGIDE
jgi:hypothetical protein